MELKDKRDISASRAEVWAALMDPEVLKDCIPGCQELTGSPEEGFEATVVQKVGPVKATFKGEVAIEDMVEPESCTITGAGKGGPAGFAKGGAKIQLHETGGVTTLHYDVEAKVGGKLAQLGGRVIDGFAKKMADSFFANFEARVESGGASEEIPTPVAEHGGAGDVSDMASTGASTPPPESRDPSQTEVPETAAKKKGWLGKIMGG